MSAPRELRAEVTPPRHSPAPTSSGVPGAATSAAFTDGDAVDSAVAMATVPSSTPSTGIR